MTPPQPIPQDHPVPFAQTTVANAVWPVVTHSSRRFEVNYIDTSGARQGGSPGRSFLASRRDNVRYHVGVDLFANPGDTVIACQAGTILAFRDFYQTSSGEVAWALYIDHGDLVINYGEITADSNTKFGWETGDRVEAGQPIAHISSTSMLHFETYIPGTNRNHRWMVGGERPAQLLNPTALLLTLVANAARQLPEDAAPLPGVPLVTGYITEGHGSDHSTPKPVVKKFIQSPHHSARNGAVIDTIVLHCTECSLDKAIATFLDPTGSTSAHYIVDRNGEIVQMVRDADIANHCKGANRTTIGIEHVGDMHGPIAPAQARASADLIRWLMEAYGIQRHNIYGHQFTPGYNLPGGTTCPDHLFGEHTQEAVTAWVAANV